MATVYGNIYKGDGYGEQVYLDYTVSQTGSKLTVTAKAGIKAATKAISIDTSAMLIDSVMCGIYTGTYQSTDYDSNQKAFTLSKGSTKQLVTKTLTFDKSKAGSQTVTLKAYSLISWLGLIMTEATTSNSSYVGVNLTVPQKTSYAIKFNANGGSGTPPSDLTKWDSETAYLPYNTLTRKGYDFVGWGTSEAGGTIYLEGAAYTGNAAATLYAIWKSNYIAPTLSNLTATRAARDGEEYVESDDGTLAHVKFNYSVPYEDYEELSHTIKIGIKEIDEDEYTYVGVEGEYELVDVFIDEISLDTEKAYDIIAVIEADGYTAISRSTYIAVAYYIIDVNTDGTAIGLGMAAPDEDTGLFVGLPAIFNDSVIVKSMAGSIQMFAGNAAPAGWLFCFGQEISRTNYDVLFDAIGTTYGTGDGSTTFNLPDLRDRFPVGAGSSYALNAKGGANTVTLSTSQIPAHTHGKSGAITSGITSSGAHTHTFKTQGDAFASGSKKGIYSTSDGTWTGTSVMTSSGAHTHNLPAHEHTSVGGGQAHENRPPYIGINFIICTGTI